MNREGSEVKAAESVRHAAQTRKDFIDPTSDFKLPSGLRYVIECFKSILASRALFGPHFW